MTLDRLTIPTVKKRPNALPCPTLMFVCVKSVMCCCIFICSFFSDIDLKNINNVIQKPDAANGDRFLLDLEVALNCTDQTFRLTEHVYQKKESGSLCLPEGMIWNNNATIYFIIPVKEQGKWIHHFIKQVTTASVLTGDTNFHVIIADFESKDIDIKEAFNTSLLNRRHTVVQLRTGKFYKTLALNKAVEVVPNAHDIVFLFDLHIDVPVNIMDSIRKVSVSKCTFGNKIT